MSKKIVKRNKFFYASPKYFPDWEYPSRLCLGMNLDDFYWKEHEYYYFEVLGSIYRISKAKAEELGRKHILMGGKMPHLIPKEEFEKVAITETSNQLKIC